jgi:phage shock protein PspC (stress-responsive transcriptional regulator)
MCHPLGRAKINMDEQLKKERRTENIVAVVVTVLIYFMLCWIIVHFIHAYPNFVEIVLGFPFVLIAKTIDKYVPFPYTIKMIGGIIAGIANILFWPLLVLKIKHYQQKKQDEVFK